jgi:hypothetical protein
MIYNDTFHEMNDISFERCEMIYFGEYGQISSDFDALQAQMI